MTPEQLLAAGYQEFNWNNGAIMEYWKPLDESAQVEVAFNQRLAVRFNEWKNRPFGVWLLTAACGIEFKGVQTVEHLEQLYALVSGSNEGVGDG